MKSGRKSPTPISPHLGGVEPSVCGRQVTGGDVRVDLVYDDHSVVPIRRSKQPLWPIHHRKREMAALVQSPPNGPGAMAGT